MQVFSWQVGGCSVHYNFNPSWLLDLPNDFLKKTSENTSINVILYLYGKKHFRPNTYAALL